MYTPMKLVYRVPIWGHAIQQSRLNPEEANVKQNNFSGNQIKKAFEVDKGKVDKREKMFAHERPRRKWSAQKNFEKK